LVGVDGELPVESEVGDELGVLPQPVEVPDPV